MTRSRDLLHFNHLGTFTDWAGGLGWKTEPVKGDFEVLRLRRGHEVAIFYARSQATEHVTTFGVGDRLARRFIFERKVG